MVQLAESLTNYKYGFDSPTEFKSLQTLTPQERVARFIQQRESYVNHLLEDQAVSILYNYYPDENGNVYISGSRNERDNIIHQIDFNERNGLFYDGILKSTKQAVDQPNELIALYSPTGKKLFDDTPIESVPSDKKKWLSEPYDIGQLYFLYFDGSKINNVAVSINNDNNPWLLEMSREFKDANQINDEEQRIAKFLTTPAKLGNVDEFLNRTWENNNRIFKNVHNQDFFLDKVIQDMRLAFAGKKKIDPSLYHDKTIQALQQSEITADIITQGYIETVYRFMKERGLSEIKFGGGCPGEGAEMSVVEQILGYDVMHSFTTTGNMFTKSISSFSSTFRDLKQKKNDDNSDEYGSLKFHCPVCNQEHTRKPHVLFVNCPKLEKEGKKVAIPKC